MSVDLAASLIALVTAGAALILALNLSRSLQSKSARHDAELASALSGFQHDRAEVMAISERLVLNHAQMSEQIRSTLSAEVENAAAFREATVEEVAELLHRHAEMLRTEMAAVDSCSDA
jgi:hypothetical protein